MTRTFLALVVVTSACTHPDPADGRRPQEAAPLTSDDTAGGQFQPATITLVEVSVEVVEPAEIPTPGQTVEGRIGLEHCILFSERPGEPIKAFDVVAQEIAAGATTVLKVSYADPVGAQSVDGTWTSTFSETIDIPASLNTELLLYALDPSGTAQPYEPSAITPEGGVEAAYTITLSSPDSGVDPHLQAVELHTAPVVRHDLEITLDLADYGCD